MAFGRKKAVSGPKVTQDNAATIAAAALSEARSIRVALAVRCRIVNPMLMHAWSTKALLQMIGKMTGHDVERGKKDIEAEFEASACRNVNGQLIVPCRTIKAAIVGGGGDNCGGVVSKAQLGRELRVRGNGALLVLPKGQEPVRDTRPAATDGGGIDIRTRMLIPEGSSFEFVMEMPPSLNPAHVMKALVAAGDIMGIGDWRPERGGEYGTFVVDEVLPNKDVQRVFKACAPAERRFEVPMHMLRAANALPKEKLTDKDRKALAVVNGHTV